MPPDLLRNLSQFPGTLLLLTLCPFFGFTWTDFADFVPVTLIVVSASLSVIYRFGRWRVAPPVSAPYTATMIVAALGPGFLYLTTLFRDYYGYCPDRHPNPILFTIVRHVMPLLCGNDIHHIGHRSAEDYPAAFAGWTIITSVAWTVALWARLTVRRRFCLVGFLAAVWVIIAVMP